MADDFDRSLAGIGLLNEVKPERLIELEQFARWRHYDAKELVFDMKSSGTELFFIVEGALQVVNYSPAGREISFALVPAGGYIGEMSSIDLNTRPATVVAGERYRVLGPTHGEDGKKLWAGWAPRISRGAPTRAGKALGPAGTGPVGSPGSRAGRRLGGGLELEVGRVVGGGLARGRDVHHPGQLGLALYQGGEG